MQPATAFYTQPVESVLQQYNCTVQGLSSSEAAERLSKFGQNTFKAKGSASSVKLFLSQFKSPITIILIAAAILSISLRDVVDSIIILVIVFISSLLGFLQEKGAANAVRRLLQIVQVRCAVLRDNREIEIPIEDVVPGDIVILNAGDI
ncbi:MAG: cation-transporting P-type ATPase, partial [Flavisolibacter sp.]